MGELEGQNRWLCASEFCYALISPCFLSLAFGQWQTYHHIHPSPDLRWFRPLCLHWTMPFPLHWTSMSFPQTFPGPGLSRKHHGWIFPVKTLLLPPRMPTLLGYTVSSGRLEQREKRSVSEWQEARRKAGVQTDSRSYHRHHWSMSHSQTPAAGQARLPETYLRNMAWPDRASQCLTKQSLSGKYYSASVQLKNHIYPQQESLRHIC